MSGCVLGVVFGGGALLVLTVGAALVALYVLGEPPVPERAATPVTVTVRNLRADPVEVRCVPADAGERLSEPMRIAPGASAALVVSSPPVYCSGESGGESVWSWTGESGTVWRVDVPAVAAAASEAHSPEVIAADVEPAATEPAAAPAKAAASGPAAPAPASRAARSPTRAVEATPAAAAAPPPVAAPVAAPTAVTVQLARKSRKQKGIAVILDGRSVGTVPFTGEVSLGMHAIQILKGDVDKTCTIAASGNPWIWQVDIDALACP
jgi:hypothetical protein